MLLYFLCCQLGQLYANYEKRNCHWSNFINFWQVQLKWNFFGQQDVLTRGLLLCCDCLCILAAVMFCFPCIHQFMLMKLCSFCWNPCAHCYCLHVLLHGQLKKDSHILFIAFKFVSIKPQWRFLCAESIFFSYHPLLIQRERPKMHLVADLIWLPAKSVTNSSRNY